MYVVTADQRGSTRTGDRVDELLEWYATWATRWPQVIRLPLERTVGDEVQLVLSDANAAVDFSLALMRRDVWSVGIGAGPVDMPLADTSRASSGPAFVHARRAVERARGKGEPTPLVVACDDDQDAAAATAALQLLGAVVRKRSAAGWEVTDLEVEGMSQTQIAHRLGISAQAVSQRRAAGLVEEEQRARPVAAALLLTAHGESRDSERSDRNA